MSGMSYDAGQISEVASRLNSSLNKFNEAVDGMFSEITAMGETWTGASYDAFKTYCEDYRSQKIEPLARQVGTWANKLENVSQRATETSQGNTALFS